MVACLPGVAWFHQHARLGAASWHWLHFRKICRGRFTLVACLAAFCIRIFGNISICLGYVLEQSNQINYTNKKGIHSYNKHIKRV